MKRLIVFIFLAVLLCAVNLSIFKNLTLDNIFPKAQVEVFTSGKTNLNIRKVDNGDGEILFCDISDLNYILEQTNNVVGCTIKIYQKDKSEVLSSLKVKDVFNQNFGTYGWSNVVSRLKNLKSKNISIAGKKVNFQCVENKDCLLLGMPIILGSY